MDYRLLLVPLVFLVVTIVLVRRYKTNDAGEFYINVRKVPSVIAGISIFTTMFSAISFVAYPGEVIQYGPTLAISYLLSLPIIYLVVTRLIMPTLLEKQYVSAYEALTRRLGGAGFYAGSIIFCCMRFMWVGLMVYTTTLVCTAIFHMPDIVKNIIPLFLLGFAVTYCLSGIKAVIYADIAQFVLLGSAAVFTVFYTLIQSSGAGGSAPVWWEPHWDDFVVFSFDPAVRITLVGTVAGSLIWWVCTAASDQIVLQRFVNTKDISAARRAFLHNNLADASITTVLILIGLMLLQFYRAGPGETAHVSEWLTQEGDKVFPEFLRDNMPGVFTMLVLMGLLAASLSSITAAITAITSVIVRLRQVRRQGITPTTAGHAAIPDQGGSMLEIRKCTVVVGVSCLAITYAIQYIQGNLMEVAAKVTGIFLCPLFALFYNGVLYRRGTKKGALLACGCSFLVSFTMAFKYDIFGGMPISFQWILPASFGTVILFSWLFRDKSLASQNE